MPNYSQEGKLNIYRERGRSAKKKINMRRMLPTPSTNWKAKRNQTEASMGKLNISLISSSESRYVLKFYNMSLNHLSTVDSLKLREPKYVSKRNVIWCSGYLLL